jgi:hypothetical protein
MGMDNDRRMVILFIPNTPFSDIMKWNDKGFGKANIGAVRMQASGGRST